MLNLHLKTVMLFVFFIFSIALSFSFYNYKHNQKIVVFDLKGTLTQFQDSLFEKNINEKNQQLFLERFSDSLEKAASEYSLKNSAVVLPSAAVITGAEDVTNILQARSIEIYKKIALEGM